MWTYKDKIFTNDDILDYVGFVYLITNLDTGKKYVGKKLFTKSKTYQKNNKKRRMRVESDWLTYTGSNVTLNEEVEQGANLKKEILHLCKYRGWLSYLETKEIINRDALLRDDYYNYWFSAKVHAKHLIDKKGGKNE